MKVIFKFEMSPEIGGGHFKRSSNLALKLKQYGCKVYFITNNNFFLKKFSQANKIPIYFIKEDTLRNNIAIIKKIKNIDLLIIDNYKINYDFEKKISKSVKKILIIDDYKNKKHFCDYYLNTSPTIKINDVKKINNSAKKFLGLDSLILDKHYQKKKISIKKKKIKNVLIFISYTDHNNVTNKILDIFRDSKYKKLNFFIISGINPKKKNKSSNESIPKNFILLKNQKSLFGILNNIDIAIGSGGINLWERCFMGIPSLVLKLSKNQNDNVNFLKQNKCIVVENFKYLKNIENSFDRLLKNYKDIFDNIRDFNYKFDAYGSDRLAYSLTKSDPKCLKLVQAKKEDISFLYKLAQDKTTIKYSLSGKSFKFKDHEKWFSDKLKSKDTKIFILNYKKLRLGQLRMDIKAKEITIDYSVDSFFRNRGLGNFIIRNMIKYIKKNTTIYKNRNIAAVVHRRNFMSVSIFTKYSFVKQNINNKFFKFILKI